MGERTAVLDASALIALLRGEPGAEEVDRLAAGALISTVNWLEVIEVIAGIGLRVEDRRRQVAGLGVSLVPLTSEQAESAAAMRTGTRTAGLSLADRACLALALERRAPAVTADRAWTKVDVGVEVRLIR